MKVLIVEDDFASREFLINLITLEGYEVYSADNGEEGIEEYQKHLPDIIISDIQMPRMDGLQMLKILRNQKSDTIFIVTTAYGSEDYAIDALRLGANNYLKKPIERKNLLSLLKKYNALVDSRKLAKKAEGKTIERLIKIEFNTDIHHIPSIVNQLINEISDNIEEIEKTNIELGLDELITNSIEHGNLEISYDEKLEAADNNTLTQLYSARMKNSEFANRKIIVEYVYNKNWFEWTITDEGKGFDWKSIPDPTEGNQLMELNGRGIFITHFLFDEMEYTGKGNKVRVRKYLKSKND
ncbi:MAG: response regulator [Bacteroidales bacterium]|nr:response regulator [Bacteroidales bacterium]